MGGEAVLLQDSHGVVGSLASDAVDLDGTVLGELTKPLAQLIERDVDGAINPAALELFFLASVQQKSATIRYCAELPEDLTSRC
jgi:hypothetical protein